MPTVTNTNILISWTPNVFHYIHLNFSVLPHAKRLQIFELLENLITFLLGEVVYSDNMISST